MKGNEVLHMKVKTKSPPHPCPDEYADESEYWRARAQWHRDRADKEEAMGYMTLARFRRGRADYFESKAT